MATIPLGALVFIVDHDGGEPARYQGDGEGNAWHVYVKISDEMLIHASASNLMVTTRLFADQTIPNGGPNAYGLISGVDYGVAERGGAASVPVGQSWTPRYSPPHVQNGLHGRRRAGTADGAESTWEQADRGRALRPADRGSGAKFQRARTWRRMASWAPKRGTR